MNKEWYILIDSKQEGPFTLLELKRHPLITPDTLVWRPGFEKWVPIRQVADLKEVFKDEPEAVPLEDLVKPKSQSTSDLKQDQDTLAIQLEPFQFYIWLLVIIIVILFVLIQTYRNG
ncbi:MAG: DUF4339 domain-containing protein [Parachlamydiaceae bacterium]|nr:DUF4339 domain-containing protein [Parachlamydiaceae bacterium]